MMGKTWLLQYCASFQHVERVDSLMDGNYLQPIFALFSVDAVEFDCLFSSVAERNSSNVLTQYFILHKLFLCHPLA